MITNLPPSQDILVLMRLALAAGREIMAVYQGDVSVRDKSDASPVTDADERAERTILAGLRQQWPNVPVIAEEATAAGSLPEIGNTFFLVDPLDGTKEFIGRNGEFTVNIALISNNKPVQGVIFAPALNKIWWGDKEQGAARANISINDNPAHLMFEQIKARAPDDAEPIVVASRSHRDAETDAFIQKVKAKSVVSAGSSLKFCMIAEGSADLYPRFGRTMEWDTAAGHAILAAAGGHVRTIAGAELEYGKTDQKFANPAFVASQ